MKNAYRRLRLAVLVSGGGTNLQAILDRSREGRLAAEVVVVVSDRAGAHGLVRAQKAGIPAHVVDYGAYLRCPDEELTRHRFPVDLDGLDDAQKILKNPDPAARKARLGRLVLAEQELLGILDGYEPDYVVLAGFMRLVTPYMIQHYNTGGRWRVLNIHPALLPSFPGGHGYEDTFQYGCKWGGITVHFVDEGEDSGPILAQAVYPVWPNDSLEQVRERGLRLEYEVYSQCVNWLAAGQVEMRACGAGRFCSTITDPDYPRVMRDWIRTALGNEE